MSTSFIYFWIGILTNKLQNNYESNLNSFSRYKTKPTYEELPEHQPASCFRWFQLSARTINTRSRWLRTILLELHYMYMYMCTCSCTCVYMYMYMYSTFAMYNKLYSTCSMHTNSDCTTDNDWLTYCSFNRHYE